MNIDLLKEDLTFPLACDTMGLYIWDAEHNMVAMFTGHSQKIGVVARLNAFAANDFHSDNSEFRYTKSVSGIEIVKDGETVLIIRGWGRLRYKDRPTERQDNIADLFIEALNSLDYEPMEIEAQPTEIDSCSPGR